MDWLWDNVTPILIDVIIALLGIFVAFLVGYLRKVSKDLQEKSESDTIDKWIERVANVAEDTVLSLEGTTAKTLKKSKLDGDSLKDALGKVKEDAIKDVLNHLPLAGKKILADAVGDLHDYVGDVVEAKVQVMKRTDTEKVVAALANPPSSSPES
jgi:hypothetical protein|tara:strand:- start:1016 stop:1480 length:465 start_codon:yes stop_codon:yes gene_type:complete